MLPIWCRSTEELAAEEQVTACIGFDPTCGLFAHRAPLRCDEWLRRLRRCGLKPDWHWLRRSATVWLSDNFRKVCRDASLLTGRDVAAQYPGRYEGPALRSSLDFLVRITDRAELVNSYDWMKNFAFLSFAFVKCVRRSASTVWWRKGQKRLDGGAAVFPADSYPAVAEVRLPSSAMKLRLQAPDGCSTSGGNITTGAGTGIRTNGGEVFAPTSLLITKGRRWQVRQDRVRKHLLDPRYTSPYGVLPVLLNERRGCQTLHKDIHRTVQEGRLMLWRRSTRLFPFARPWSAWPRRTIHHGSFRRDYNAAVMHPTSCLAMQLPITHRPKLDGEDTLLAVFEGVPQFEISRDALAAGCGGGFVRG